MSVERLFVELIDAIREPFATRVRLIETLTAEAGGGQGQWFRIENARPTPTLNRRSGFPQSHDCPAQEIYDFLYGHVDAELAEAAGLDYTVCDRCLAIPPDLPSDAVRA